MGIAFLLVTVALSFSDIGRGWWFWMFIPAFSMMGTGIAQYIRFREHQNRSLPGFVCRTNADSCCDSRTRVSRSQHRRPDCAATKCH